MREKRGRRMKPGVGYIGFGNKINVISKSFKIPFSKVKQIYGDELEKLTLKKEIGNLSFYKISKVEKEKIRKKIKLEIKKDRFKEFILFTFSCLLLSIFIYLLLVWFVF